MERPSLTEFGELMEKMISAWRAVPPIVDDDFPEMIHYFRGRLVAVARAYGLNEDGFEQLRAANLSRVKRWHPGGLSDWSVLEWAGAMCGEAGEAANVAKKMRREQTDAKGLNDPAELKSALAREISDTLIYLDLLAAKADIDLFQAVADTFNKKSQEYGFPERL